MSLRRNRSVRIRHALERRLGRTAAEHAYLVRHWQIVERELLPADAAALESVFAVANGRLGIRGAPEEGTPAHAPGVTLNGLHETWPSVYPEDANGLARTGQAVVIATDGSVLRLAVDGEPFDPAGARLMHYERVLDMQLGVLTRDVEWETERGWRIAIRSRRLRRCTTVAGARRRLGGLRDYDGEVRSRPRLPDGWERLRFRVTIRGQRVEVDMRPDATTYRLLEGRGLLVAHDDELLALRQGEPVSHPAAAGDDELPLAT